jgi:hypothetical protein
MIAALVLLAASTPSGALEAADRAALRNMVEQQIEAFRRDDADAAYAFASPGLQSLFSTPERFLKMVREGYGPVHRARSYTFGPDRDTLAGPDLSLRIQDGDGVDWDAVYSFERTPEGAWRISGCRLVKAPGETA